MARQENKYAQELEEFEISMSFRPVALDMNVDFPAPVIPISAIKYFGSIFSFFENKPHIFPVVAIETRVDWK
jgi:hypothetical protein